MAVFIFFIVTGLPSHLQAAFLALYFIDDPLRARCVCVCVGGRGGVRGAKVGEAFPFKPFGHFYNVVVNNCNKFASAVFVSCVLIRHSAQFCFVTSKMVMKRP